MARNDVASTYLTSGDLPSFTKLADLMDRYQTSQLASMSPDEFRQSLEARMAEVRPDFEHFTDQAVQRNQSVAFKWGHNHDFGTFRLQGQMADRHIRHLSVFSDHFGQSPENFAGKQVLDIGCWTGGVTLLLAALGAEILAVDEVRKYVDTVQFLADSFGVNTVNTLTSSLYNLTGDELQDRFDYVMFAGVLYHVTDPIVCMRILFNTLKDGGTCLVESTGRADPAAVFGYERRRWNWFDPSPGAMKQLMEDVGFVDVKVGSVTPGKRLYAVGRRESHVDMRRDGLSVPTLR